MDSVNRIENSSAANESSCVSSGTAPAELVQVQPSGALESLRSHWPEYLMEAALLGAFMVSACVFGSLFEFPNSPVRQAISSPLLRRLLMGLAMGLTAVAIIYSPWGKQSGAHINPSVTLTFFRLGKIRPWDAFFYVLAHFAGATFFVLVVAMFLGSAISDPAVRYVVTVPGPDGPWVALGAEFLISACLMVLVLAVSNHDRWNTLTGLFVGILLALYITFESPFSGTSLNPARTFGSAFPPRVWDGLWIYLTAPPLGMLAAAEFYLFRQGRHAAKCAKLHHANTKRCIFCGANGGFAS